MSSLEPYLDIISNMLRCGKTYMEISVRLQNTGVERGSSVANIRKFCREYGINPGSISDTELKAAVDTAVEEVSVTDAVLV